MRGQVDMVLPTIIQRNLPTTGWNEKYFSAFSIAWRSKPNRR